MGTKTLIREDKNGTKYYHNVCACGKCGGTGIIPCYITINGGECFSCWGSGIVEYDTKEYTPEYEAKLEARRIARQAKKDEKAKAESVEKNKEFFEKQGFDEEGRTWAVLGNTYSIKEELKEKGARWMQSIQKWTFNHEVEEYPTVELSVDDIYYKDYTFTYRWNNFKSFSDDPSESAFVETFSKKIEEAEKMLSSKENNSSEYIGEISEKISVTAKYNRSFYFDTKFGTQYIHKFTTEDGSILVWKTGVYIDIEEGKEVSITGTVKSHDEYRSEKQTQLIRCKIS